jgi:hypothetical protein
VIAVNKWDTVPLKTDKTLADYEADVRAQVRMAGEAFGLDVGGLVEGGEGGETPQINPLPPTTTLHLPFLLPFSPPFSLPPSSPTCSCAPLSGPTSCSSPPRPGSA